MVSEQKNYYDILEISPSASVDEIKSTYRKLARKYHPDVAGDSGAEKFKEVREAYETLSDETKRKRYDILRGIFSYNKTTSDNAARREAQKAYRQTEQQEEVFKSQNQYSQKSTDNKTQQKQEENKKEDDAFQNIFKDIMNGFHNASQKQNKKKTARPVNGTDITTDVIISMEEALNGVSKTVNILSSQECSNCHGRVFANGMNCPVCDGTGVESQHKKITVKIPANIKPNSKIRIPSEGNPGTNGGKNGDLYLNVVIENNTNFKYDDLNILFTIPITPSEAVLGTSINVPTSSGNVSMKIMPKTSSGQKYRLAGLGLTKNGVTGDMIVTVNIEIPKNLSDEEIALYKKLHDLAQVRL